MIFSINFSYGQIRFEQITVNDTIAPPLGSPFAYLNQSCMTIGDVNGDGYNDIFIMGSNPFQPNEFYSKLYFNSDSTVFSEASNLNVFAAGGGDADLFDMDGDNDLDLLVIGNDRVYTYKNDGLGGFEMYPNDSILAMYQPDVAHGDYDNDGDIDIIIVGSHSVPGPVCILIHHPRLYLNDGAGNFTEDPTFSSEGFEDPCIACADIDNDNDLDCFIAGSVVESGTEKHSIIGVNDGSGGFTQNPGVGGVSGGDILFEDFNGDGYIDKIISGVFWATHSTARYEVNDGSGNFVNDPTFSSFTHVSASSMDAADIDNDGDMDLVIMGKLSNGNKSTTLYRNDGTGIFSEILNLPFDDLYGSFGDVEFAELNNDGLIDIVFTGGSHTRAYLNAYCSELAGDLNCNGVYDSGEIVGDYNQNGVIDNNEIPGDSNGTGVIESGEVIGDANNDGVGYDCMDYVLLNYTIDTHVTVGESELTAENSIGSYQWYDCVQDLPISIATNQNYFPSVSGEYSVIVTEGNCSDTSLCERICILNKDVSVSESTIISLDTSPSTTYQWLECSTGNIISGELGQSYTPTMNGEYSVIISQGGCVDTSVCNQICILDLNVSVEGEIILSMDNPDFSTYEWIDCNTQLPIVGATMQNFTPMYNGDFAVIVSQGSCSDTSNCATFSTLAINELENTEFSVYPNPIGDVVSIDINGQLLVRISIYDAFGRLIKVEQEPSFSVADLSSGIYILLVETDSGVLQKKVLKE